MIAPDPTLPPSWHALPERLRKPFWSTSETAEVLDCSKDTLRRRWREPDSGFPRPVRMRGRLFVSSLQLLRFLDPPPPPPRLVVQQLRKEGTA